MMRRGRRPAAGARAGMTLMELMVAMVMMALVLGAAMNFFVGQSRTYTAAAKQFNQVQNVRFGADLLDQHLRAAGANMTPGQPPIVYMDTAVFSFNADYASADSGTTAIYYTPGAPVAETQGVLSANQFNIPGIKPVYTYPTIDYEIAPGVPSPAELITFWFAKDTTTAGQSYVLYRQVNNGIAEAVVRNILPDTVPFFQYTKLAVDVTGNKTLVSVPKAQLPAAYTTSLVVDSLRAVQITYRVSNGDTGTAQRIQSFQLYSALPNLENRELRTCGNIPQDLTSVTATANFAKPDTVKVTWPADGDEWGGERDIMRYVVWRRVVGAPNWGAPYVTIPNGQNNYTFVDLSLTSGTQYEYAVSAQDCTPNFSTPVLSNKVTAP